MMLPWRGRIKRWRRSKVSRRAGVELQVRVLCFIFVLQWGIEGDEVSCWRGGCAWWRRDTGERHDEGN